MRNNTQSFSALHGYIQSLPIVDCHDHTAIPGPRYADPIEALMDGYYTTDFISMCGDETEAAWILNQAIPWRERYSKFERWLKLSWHTGYGMVVKRVLQQFYGQTDVSKEALEAMEGQLLDLTDHKRFDQILEDAGIAVRITDLIWVDDQGKSEEQRVVEGSLELAPRARFTIPMVRYHGLTSYEEFHNRVKWVKPNITCLDDYLDGCWQMFTAYRNLGAVAFKDQSAYTRSLAYGNPTRAEAEKIFNWIMEDPRRSAGHLEPMKALDDYLFHSFLRMAGELKLPVQLHTGLLAGLRNNITQANASHLIPVLELHRNVQFDLFHANWPFGGEWLFLGKNYPNVYLNFCWANIIDPIYCQNLFQQCISVVPHGKVFAYGSDFVGQADHAWAHADIMRENLTIALSNLVEIDYLTHREARDVAMRWLYENPNEFFGLGLPQI